MNKHPSPEQLHDATPGARGIDQPTPKKRAKATKPEPRICIMVLGMHRSGTSALTRVISLLGAALPHQVLNPDDSNASGYWEPTNLNHLNEKMLAEAGSRWDDWRSFDPGDLGRSRILFYKTEISRIVDEEYGNASAIVLKEPRISRFVQLYAAVLKKKKFQLHYVLAIRNPLEVIASLSKRDGSTFATGSLLWLRHQIEAERATRGMSRVFVSYDAMMVDWRLELTKIITTLPSGWSRSFEEVGPEIDAYLSSDHRHHAINDDRLSADERVLPWVKEAYTAFRALEADPNDTRALAILDGITAEFDAQTLVFGEAVFPELKKKSEEFRFLEGKLRELLNQKVEEIRELSASKHTMLHGFNAERSSWTAQRDEAQQEIRALQQSAAEARRSEAAFSEAAETLEKALSLQKEKAEVLIATNEKKYLADIREKYKYIEALQAKVDQIDQDIKVLRLDAGRKSDLISAIQKSSSWRVTAGLRYVRRFQVELPSKVRSATERGLVALWRRAPIGGHRKAVLKAALFKNLPWFFEKFDTYRQWLSNRQIDNLEVKARPKISIAGRVDQKLARIICFYLPQFHEIPENDAWWGKGFTEWSNVVPAQAQFKGHNQPRNPADLGYYNLLQSDVQRRQIEMASSAGIEGFCFYFYWFGGKRLLEKPVDNYLADTTLDFPFCLCWANENWSRRWDGLESDILIGQNHSPDDDIAFIREIARFMQDDRYIRIGDKPLLLVYRPSLFPSARDTATRWRTWCRENGIGEIFLACTQSFEQADPADYGFDAAVEFPPNNSAPPDITDQVQGFVPKFGGRVYDWTALLKRSLNYASSSYVTFRGVCPAWDNTARRKNKGNIFVNNSPRLFEEWLKNAVDDSLQRFQRVDERLVFVNAWNEWAEGAYLEPDDRDEFAYLRAVRNAVFLNHRSEYLPAAAINALPAMKLFPRVALVVHAYYPELLSDILDIASENPFPIKIFVTTGKDSEGEVRNCLEKYSIPFLLKVVENRGRDVLPFFKILPEVLREDIPYVVKVHTKKSPHRVDGDFWRQDLVRKVLSYEALNGSLERFEADPRLGMIGPAGHFVSMTTYLGSNHSRLVWLAEKLGLTEERILREGFFAGTMFAARTACMAQLQPLVADDLFDLEAGQVDGTFAHVLERGFALSAVSLGMKIEESHAGMDLEMIGRGVVPAESYPHA
ncbi:glycoside hydrolase family 99-like domain-containing protein [Mesorhizobium loti]|uniref:glycoside hydrolase family 99-like domain-containing protein n=1 Tax=Rhizobium loti TaxID=381 RepID=UPI000406D593|nr:glycoside hydrolase family 99-like domain-containing protein [Mesorhizobium loti]